MSIASLSYPRQEPIMPRGTDLHETAAQAAFRAGFDGVVLSRPDGAGRRSPVPAGPSAIIISHRAAGSPVAAARRLWDLAERSGGRIAIQIVETGSDAADEGHVQSLRRIDEYLTLPKRLWTSDRPFDHEGPCYSIRRPHGFPFP